MNEDEDMDSGGYGRARLSGKARGLLLAVLMAGFATLIAFFVIDVGRGPESNGGRLDDFLNDPKSGKCNFLDSETISWVQGFGPEAIPPLAAAVLNGGRNDEPAMDWLRKLFAMEPVERVKPKVRQRMALASLAALGGKHPKKVDAAYLPLLSTSNRFDAIYWLGLAGPRHFSFLTNLVAGTNFGEAEQAISSLVWMGTNADPAVPLLFSAIERHRENSPRRWWLSILAFRHIGPGHPFTVSRLLEYTEDEHPAVRSHSIFVLSGFTNESSRIIPHFLRLLREGDITRINDTGYSVARKLQGIGTPAHQAFPMLFARLKQAAELSLEHPRHRQMLGYLRLLENYGFRLPEVSDCLEQEILPRMEKIADPANGHPPGEQKAAKSAVRYIHQFLVRTKPAWKPPVSKP